MDRIPPSIIANAKLFCPQVVGDAPSIAIAQWILETGWGKSKLWRESLNPFGIKDARDDRFQIPGGGIHAAYESIPDAFKDRKRILEWYKMRAGGASKTDILLLLDRWWAPDQDYKEKLLRLIEDHNLDRFNVATIPDEEDEYDPRDPRDFDPPGMGGGLRRPVGKTGDSAMGAFLWRAVPIVAGLYFSGAFRGLDLKGLGRQLMGSLRVAETTPAPSVIPKSTFKHGLAKMILSDKLDGSVADALIPLGVELLNLAIGKEWGSAVQPRPDTPEENLGDVLLKVALEALLK